MLRFLSATLFAVLLAPLIVTTSLAEPLAPLDAAGRAQMAAPVEDPAPKTLLGQAPGLENKHYLVGNEWHLDLYAPKIPALGGAYLGVGSDQAYIFLGMVRPQVAWLTDYDDLVVQLHKIYFAFLAEAADNDAFMKLWSDEAAGSAILGKRLAGDAEAAELGKFYKRQRGRIYERLQRVSKGFSKTKAHCYLNDAETYAFVRSLVTGGRLRAMRVDLLADKGVVSIAAAARALGQPVRAIYLSNAENYWNYSKQFRANMAALPFDDKALVIRTVSTWDWNYDYSYNLQPAQNFLGWLAKPWVHGYRDFVHWKRPEASEFLFFETKGDPEAEEQARQKRKGVKAPSAKPKSAP